MWCLAAMMLLVVAILALAVAHLANANHDATRDTTPTHSSVPFRHTPTWQAHPSVPYRQVPHWQPQVVGPSGAFSAFPSPASTHLLRKTLFPARHATHRGDG